MVELCTFIILKRVKDNRCFRLFSIVYETCKLKRTIKFVQAERSRDFGGPLVPADYYCCWCCCCCCFYSLYPFCSSVLSFRAKNAFKILLCECMCERSVIVGHISRYCFDARAILLVSLKKTNSRWSSSSNACELLPFVSQWILFLRKPSFVKAAFMYAHTWTRIHQKWRKKFIFIWIVGSYNRIQLLYTHMMHTRTHIHTRSHTLGSLKTPNKRWTQLHCVLFASKQFALTVKCRCRW